MKKFFKGLALVLALVLVLGTIPASNASAKVATSKKLYLNGGTAKKNTAKLYKLAGVKKADAAKVTAESSDSKIVKAGTKKLTAKAEGEAEVKVMVDGKLVTTVKVTVKDLAKPAEVELKAQSAVQTASNAIQVVFNKEVEDLTKADFNIYYKAGDAKVYGNVVNTVKQNADNKKAWDVVFFSNFVAKEDYFVEVTGIELTFTAAGNSYKDVTAVKLDGPATVTVNEVSKEYKLKYYNAAGMDITSSVDESKFTITMSAADITDGYFSSNTAYFWTVGATATVKAKVEILNDKFEYVTVAEDSMAISCVSAAELTYAGVNTWTFAPEGADAFIETWSKINQNFAVGDTRQFQAIFNTVKGTEKGTQQVKAGDPGYRFESADPSIAIVTSVAGTDAPFVYGVKAGETYIKIYSVDSANKVNTLVTAVPISVKAARTASAVTTEWSQANLNVATLTADDSITLTIKVKDQYGDPINVASWQKFECKSGDTYLANLGGFNFKGSDCTPGETGTYTITFSRINTGFDGAIDELTYVKNGTYTATLKIADVTVGLSLPVGKYTGDDKVNGYKLGAVSSFDTALTAQTKYAAWQATAASDELKVNNITLCETINGYYYKDVATFEMVTAVPKRATDSALGAGTHYVYTVTKNGSLCQRDENEFRNNYFKLFWNDGAAIKKASKGTYVITAYKVVVDNDDLDECSVKKLDSVTFSITDSQLKPSFVQKAGAYEDVDTADALAVFKACFKPSFDGKTYDDWTKAEAAGYSVASVNSKVDTKNKTMVILSANIVITNKNEDTDNIFTSAAFNPYTIENVEFNGIVQNK